MLLLDLQGPDYFKTLTFC